MKSYFLTVPKRRKKAPLWKGFFLNFEYDSTAIKPSDKRSDGLIYIRSIRVKSLVLIRKASLHFGVRYSYNLLPEKLPAVNPPAYFAVHSRFAPGSRIIVEGSILRWRRRFRKDREFSVRDIAGVALGPGNGCNVLYGRDYQILAKFAGSMEHADLMFLWLLQKEVPIVYAPDIWHSPAEASPEPEPVRSSALQQQFTLRLKRSARIGFTGIGWFLLLIGVALFLERV